MRRRVSSGWLRALLAAALLTSLSFSPLGVRAESPRFSRPAAVISNTLPPGEPTLLGVSVEPFYNTLDLAFAGQLTAGTNKASADRILLWDTTEQNYIVWHLLASPQGQPRWVAQRLHLDQRAVHGPLRRIPPTQLAPGIAFFAENRQPVPQQLHVAGWVPQDPVRRLSFTPALNLFAYPYLSTASAAEAGLGVDLRQEEFALDRIYRQDGHLWLYIKNLGWAGANDQAADFTLKAGRGYWYHNFSDTQRRWTVPRPYALAASQDLVPSISGIVVQDNHAFLAIKGLPGARVHVLVKDITADQRSDLLRGWSVAAAGIAGSPELIWQDPRPLSTPGIRLYQVLDATQDTDGDGVADGIEFLVHNTPWQAPDPSPDYAMSHPSAAELMRMTFNASPTSSSIDLHITSPPDGTVIR